MLLSDIREDMHRNPTSETVLTSISASKCLEHCQRGASQLQELINDMYVDLTTSRGIKLKWTSAKVVIRKDKISRYKSRLESSIRLLSLSYQIYTRLVPFDLRSYSPVIHIYLMILESVHASPKPPTYSFRYISKTCLHTIEL